MQTAISDGSKTMADKTNGALIVSDDVLADLVGYAAKECYGVVGMTSPAPTSVQEGIAGLLPAQRLRRGIEIDRDENGKLCGDVDFAAVSEKASYITPVPGGVGPMTRAILMRNVLAAAKAHQKQP